MKINANDILINYRLSGKRDAPLIVLSHSLASSMVMWEPQMHALETRFRVLRYDMRGHGESEAPEGSYTLDLLAADVIGLLDALDLERAHFVGLSIGGMIGQCLALNHAQRFLSVCLCDTAAVIPQEAKPLFEARMQLAREKGMSALAEETLQRWFTAPFLRRKPALVDHIKAQIINTPLAGFIGCSQAILGLDYLERLGEVKLPTLIIVGEDDPGTPVEAAEAISMRIENAQLVVLPEAAHLSNIEQAEQFNDVVVQFLSIQDQGVISQHGSRP